MRNAESMTDFWPSPFWHFDLRQVSVLAVRFLPSFSVFETPSVLYHPRQNYHRQICFTFAQHINFGRSHCPQKNPPKSPKWGPQHELPGNTRTKGFCGNSTESTRISRNFPAHPDFGFWGPHFQRSGGDCLLGIAEICCWRRKGNHRHRINGPAGKSKYRYRFQCPKGKRVHEKLQEEGSKRLI